MRRVADYLVMAPAAAFTEVLDACVDRFESGEPVAARRWHPGIATGPLFAFTRTAPPAPATGREPSRLRLVVPRPARRLTPLQQDALDQLNGFGARLGADFTATELRSAFRSLARAFHPDHHSGAGASEKAILSFKFATVRGAYDRLRLIS